VTGGAARVLGDQLHVEPTHVGDAPTDVRIPVDVPPGACFAADTWVESDKPNAGSVGIYLGVVEGQTAVRMLRPELSPRDPPVSLKNASLSRWAGKRVEIRIAVR